jgi:hypothetical protein
MKEQSVTLFQKPDESSINDSSRVSKQVSYADRSNTNIPEWAFAPSGKHKGMKRSTIVRKEKARADYAAQEKLLIEQQMR